MLRFSIGNLPNAQSSHIYRRTGVECENQADFIFCPHGKKMRPIFFQLDSSPQDFSLLAPCLRCVYRWNIAVVLIDLYRDTVTARLITQSLVYNTVYSLVASTHRLITWFIIEAWPHVPFKNSWTYEDLLVNNFIHVNLCRTLIQRITRDLIFYTFHTFVISGLRGIRRRKIETFEYVRYIVVLTGILIVWRFAHSPGWLKYAEC